MEGEFGDKFRRFLEHQALDEELVVVGGCQTSVLPCATGIVQCCIATCLLVFGQHMQLLAWNLCECSSQAKTFEEECLG